MTFDADRFAIINTGCDYLAEPNRARAIACIREIAETVRGSVTVQEVAARCGIKPHTLFNYCLEEFGVSPGRYLRRERLRRCYEALLDADPRHGSVNKIAVEHGFHEPSRFAMYYREMFDELPLETLKRQR